MRALFEVGEEVILCSKTFQELSGEAVVLRVVKLGLDRFACPHCGEERLFSLTKGKAYYLSVPSKNKDYGCCSPWAESALRKKHKGSDFSFNQIMSEIKSTEKINA